MAETWRSAQPFDPANPVPKAPAAPAPAPAPAYTPPAPLPVAPIFKDPATAAFARSSGLITSIASDDAARQRQAIAQARGIGMEAIDDNNVQSRRAIGGRNEANGIGRSGQNLLQLAEQERDALRQRGILELSSLDHAARVESSLLDTIARSQMGMAEQGLTSAGNQYYNDSKFAMEMGK